MSEIKQEEKLKSNECEENKLAEAKNETIDINIYINDENKKNKHKIICTKCSSIILTELSGNYIDKEIELPVMKTNAELRKQLTDAQQTTNGSVKSNNEFELEKLNNYWCIDDIYTFENVGFSNTVNDMKYLICADCEYGPIGIHYIDNKKSYLSLKRVNHQI